MSNRLGITMRFNLEEQRELQLLCAQYGRPARDIMKMAFALLVDSNHQMQRKFEADRVAAQKAAAANADAATDAKPDTSQEPQLADPAA